MLADTAKLAVQLDLKGNFTNQLRTNQKALGQFDAAVTRTGSRAHRAGQQVGTGFLNAGRLVAAGAATATGALIGVLKVAGDFESQLNTINTIARKNSTELGLIGEGIRKVARDTGASLDDLTTGYYDLLSAGIKAADAQNVLTQANTLAIGGLSTTAEAVDLLTTAINTYGGDATKAAKYTDVFAKAIERGKITAADLAANFSSVGPLAASLGIEIEELGAGFATLTAAGTSAGEASTQMASALSALLKKTPDLEKLEKATGRNYAAIAGSKGLNVALQQMQKDADKAGIELVDLVGRKEALLYILQTTGPNMAKYNANLTAMGDAAGTAAEQMAERQKGLNFQLGILKARVTDAAIVIGSELLPKITPVFERLNKALADPKVISQIQAFGEKLAGLFTDKNIDQGVKALQGAFEIAKDAAPVIADAARITGSALKVAVDLFRSLPPEIQGLAVAGLAINKITGGLVTNLAGGLISSVLKQLVSGVVNVNGAVVHVNGGVGGVPGGPGGKGGGKGGLLGGLALGLGAGIVLEGTGGLGFLDNPAQLDAQKARIKELTDSGLTYSKAFIQVQREIRDGTLAINRAAQAGEVYGPPTSETYGPSTQMAGAGIAGALGTAIAAANRGISTVLSSEFRQVIAALNSSKTPAEIRSAVAKAVNIAVTQGRGNVEATKTLLAGLKEQLKNTSDPKTRQVLRDAIAKVQAKIPGREFVQKQLAKADGLLNSNKTTAQKIEALKQIQTTLTGKSVTAVNAVAAKIDLAKRQQVYATQAATQAIKDQDLLVSVSVPITSYVQVSGRDVIRNSYRLSRLENRPL